MKSSTNNAAQQAYDRWKENKTPANMSALLRSLDPLVKSVAGTHGVSNDSNVLWAARAHLARQIMDRYSPDKANISTFTYQTLQRIPRIAAQQRNAVKVPETSDFDLRKVRDARENLYERFNREPSDEEVADHLGMDIRRIKTLENRYARPVMSASHAEDVMGAATGDDIFSDDTGRSEEKLWRQYSTEALDPTDKKIYDWMSRSKPLSKVEIASRLGMSPSAVSQRTSRISQELNALSR